MRGCGDGGRGRVRGPRRRSTDNGHEPLRTPVPPVPNPPQVAIQGASVHNVRDVDCEIPLGRLTCISGVSGAGKSSFVRGVLAPALLQSVGGRSPDFTLRHGSWRSIEGTGSIREVVALDQVMPPPNRRSLVATFTGVFDDIRKVFGNSPAAKRDGLSASDFGVNSGERTVPGLPGGWRGRGRRPVVRLPGVRRVPLWSLRALRADRRHKRAGSARYAGGAAERLRRDFPHPAAPRLRDVRPGDRVCLSGPAHRYVERRRGTAAAPRDAAGRGFVWSEFFILDEPAVGLHPHDVRRLAAALDRVLDGGRNTMVIVEHDLQLIRSADWVIEFGPGSGPDGGRIVFAGSPAQMAAAGTPTGVALAGKLPTWKRPPQPRERTATEHAPPLQEQVARTTALMRTLISGDAAETFGSDEGSVEPMVVVSERFWSERDSWEVAGLDHELPKLLLDLQRPRARTSSPSCSPSGRTIKTAGSPSSPS